MGLLGFEALPEYQIISWAISQGGPWILVAVLFLDRFRLWNELRRSNQRVVATLEGRITDLHLVIQGKRAEADIFRSIHQGINGELEEET